MELLKSAMIIAAAALLLNALLPVRRLVTELPKGASRRGWHWLAGLVVIMIGCYSAYARGHRTSVKLAEELIIPSLLLFGSWFILMVSQLSAAGIHDARRLARLERECITDSLTGIYNRRFFDHQLLIEHARAVRNDKPVSLMLMDIDHFKSVNDAHGHQAGDQTLIEIAGLVQRLSRCDDVVARFGGEELAIISPGSSLEQTRLQAERLREAVKKHVTVKGGDAAWRVNVTASIGVATLQSGEASEPTAILRRADEALYQAKSNGRDCVVVEGKLPSPRVVKMKDWVDGKSPTQAA